jgi:multidrug efflux system membrane fusion protein
VVTQIQPISVMFTLPEDVVLQINQALAGGSVAVTALSRDNRTQLDSGTLALVDNEIDQTTGTVRLKATFPNEHNTLWPGQFVNVRVVLQSRHDVVTLPSAAVEHGPDGLFAYVIKADSTVEARPIKTIEDTEGITVVSDGLQSGERVVTSNQYRLQPGAKVRPVAPAASSAADPKASKIVHGPAP